MEHIRKNFGFGCMRLPMDGENVNIPETKQMVDAFLDAGFNYFDTAHGYLQGKSETALRECLTSRYPRERYILTDKLTANFFKTEADIRPFFESQLAACGVEYFDFYLMHAQGAGNYPHFRACHAYETAFRLKAEGKVRHVGISFHDTAEVLEQILADYPDIEVVQIQFNYLDYDDPAVQSRRCYEVCHDMTQIIKDAYKDARFRKGDKLAGMRVIPLIIEEEKLRRAEEAAGDEPLLQLLPFVKKTACIVTTGSEVKKGLIQDTFTPVVVEKLQAYGIETIAAGVEVTRADITAFGEGGLCLGCGQCHYPICPFGK